MRIESLHIDGYGVHSDLTIDPIDPGLSVIFGQNEAGKSTLLDFLRGMIFGFPDRRQRRPLHEPLRGGRHGGSIRIADDMKGTWTINRYMDGGRLEVLGPNNNLVDPETLNRLLGGADDKLFRAVFAFGLGELSNFESLDSDDVRELVFSAGILGAGRSATRAIRALEQRQAALIRPKQKEARVNQLRERLNDVQAKLRDARSSAEGYGEVLLAVESLRATADGTAVEIESLRRRENEIELLRHCWPVSRRAEQASKQLHEVAEIDEYEARLLQLGPELHQLANEHSGHAQRIQQFKEQSNQRVGIEHEIAQLQMRLGPTFDLDAFERDSVGIELKQRIESMNEQFLELRAERRVLDTDVRHCADVLDETTANYAQELSKRPLRTEDELREQLHLLNELKRLVLEHDRQVSARAAEEREQALSLLASRKQTSPVKQWGTVAWASFVSVLFVALSIVFAYRKELGMAEAAAGALLATIVVGTVRLARAHRHQPHATVTEEQPQDGEVKRLSEEIAQRSALVGLRSEAGTAEIEALQDRLGEERSDRRTLDELLREQESADRRFNVSRLRLRQHDERLGQLEAEAASFSNQLGFRDALSPQGLLEAVTALVKGKDLSSAHRRLSERLTALQSEIGSFRSQVARICDEVNFPSGDLLSFEEIQAVLDQLCSSFDALSEAQSQRQALRRSVSASIEDINEALGEGSNAERLREELASGAVLDWDSERERLRGSIANLAERHEQELALLFDTERDVALRARSDEIASLELERQSLETDLEKALCDWTILGVARAMLSRTLERYEQDRQPAVIARAAELFSKVTDGRYLNVVAREDDDGRHHGISVLTGTGQRIDASDLSRGTAEQLYLCLRLAFAMTFADRAVSLPLIFDDVLVNFDPTRARAMAQAVQMAAQSHQVLAFTCHPHVVEHFKAAAPNATIIELAGH